MRCSTPRMPLYSSSTLQGRKCERPYPLNGICAKHTYFLLYVWENSVSIAIYRWMQCEVPGEEDLMTVRQDSFQHLISINHLHILHAIFVFHEPFLLAFCHSDLLTFFVRVKLGEGLVGQCGLKNSKAVNLTSYSAGDDALITNVLDKALRQGRATRSVLIQPVVTTDPSGKVIYRWNHVGYCG